MFPKTNLFILYNLQLFMDNTPQHGYLNLDKQQAFYINLNKIFGATNYLAYLIILQSIKIYQNLDLVLGL